MSVPPAAPASPRLPGHRLRDLAIIAAVASNGVIGVAGGLPWRLPDDLKRFRTLTRGHTVIMGRKTWESLRGPLADRQNIVVTSRAAYAAPGAEVATGLDDALARVEMPPPAFCIGGADLYRAALPRARSLHLTEIARAFEGDVVFPAYDRAEWHEVAREACTGDGDLAYAFVTYERAG